MVHPFLEAWTLTYDHIGSILGLSTWSTPPDWVRTVSLISSLTDQALCWPGFQMFYDALCHLWFHIYTNAAISANVQRVYQMLFEGLFTAKRVKSWWRARAEKHFISATCALHINDGKTSSAARSHSVGSLAANTHTQLLRQELEHKCVDSENFNVNVTRDESIILWLSEQHLALLNLHMSPENA